MTTNRLQKPSELPRQAQTPALVHGDAIPRIAIIIVSVYSGAQRLAVIAGLKIGVVAGPAVDLGAFIYPIAFTLRDLRDEPLSFIL